MAEITCPINDLWLKKMGDILPPGLRGRLEPYIRKCIDERMKSEKSESEEKKEE